MSEKETNINIEMERAYETDWLTSSHVFFNEKTGKVSDNINDVIDYAEAEFDPEGLHTFLLFGFSAFGITPVKDVKYLQHSSRLEVGPGNALRVKRKSDPAIAFLQRSTSEQDVLDMIRQSICSWEKSIAGEIVIPTSGGYDSRLLNLMVSDRSRIRSFSFGISPNQEQSFEAVFAQRLSQLLQTSWAWIPLGEFHKFIDEWYSLKGISTHAHGMYQIEFHRKVRDILGHPAPLLSGIIGDGWAGTVKIPEILTADQVPLIGYSHGIVADRRQCRIPVGRLRALEEYFETHRESLKDPLFRIVEAMRFKMVLLSYLMEVPKSLGFSPFSPFLDISIATGMLTLPEARRQDRAWQRDFFRLHRIHFEDLQLQVDRTNVLDKAAFCYLPGDPLKAELLREVMNEDYIHWINNTLRALTFHRRANDPAVQQAYEAYRNLMALQKFLEKRNIAREKAK